MTAVVVACCAVGALAIAALVIQVVRLHQRDSQPLSRLTDLSNNTVDPDWQQARKTMQPPVPGRTGTRRSRRGHRR